MIEAIENVQGFIKPPVWDEIIRLSHLKFFVNAGVEWDPRKDGLWIEKKK